MKTPGLPWGAALVLTACASGPRAMPASATPAARLEQAEAALLGARDVSAAFEVASTGPTPDALKGTLLLAGGNSLQLLAEGTFEKSPVRLELDSRTGETLRSTTRGPSAFTHREPVAGALGPAVALKLVRLGLRHDLARLAADEVPDNVAGGVGQWVRALEPKDAGAGVSNGEACHKVAFTVEVDGKPGGEAQVCVSDLTSLPLERTATARSDAGDVQVTERYKWMVK